VNLCDSSFFSYAEFHREYTDIHREKYFANKFIIKMKTFKKIFKINAEPSDIYSALTNSYTIELWSGYPAQMSPVPGSEFSLWNGDITGINLEFVHDKKVVQEWYFGDQVEKSIVTITIDPDRENSLVTVEHTNIPDEEFKDIAEGWREYYIGAIINFFNPNF
jgi:activator of HSP90 ATPase